MLLSISKKRLIFFKSPIFNLWIKLHSEFFAQIRMGLEIVSNFNMPPSHLHESIKKLIQLDSGFLWIIHYEMQMVTKSPSLFFPSKQPHVYGDWNIETAFIYDSSNHSAWITNDFK